jgi:hypothetical protein
MVQKGRKNLGNFSRTLVGVLLAATLLLSRPLAAQAQQSDPAVTGTLKAFVLTSTYGVLAGGLTGLASLAFYPGHAADHTRNIAMGASIGLYVGILLGAYIVYGPTLLKSSPEAPEPKEKPENPEDPINLGAGLGNGLAPTLSYLPQTGVQLGVAYRF